MAGGTPIGTNQMPNRIPHEGTTSQGRDVLNVRDEIPTRIDEVSDTMIYMGWGRPGANENSAIWKIKRTYKINTVWYQEYADGNEFFDNIWANRSSLNYL